jgi:hypothetical protein
MSAAMKITGTGPLRSSPARRKDAASGTASGAFAAELNQGARAQGTAGSGPVETLEALLAIQEVPDATQSGRRAQRHAEDLLDRLEEVRNGLLAGALPRQKLDELARLVRLRRDQILDPRLAEVLDEIELRCRVELAKLEAVG